MKTGKIIIIIVLSIAVLCYVLYRLFFLIPVAFILTQKTDDNLTREEIISTVTQNANLLDKVPLELNQISNEPFYIDAAKNDRIIYISIVDLSENNKVLCELYPEDEHKDIIYNEIINENLFKIFNIKGIQTINKYYSDSGRYSIQFDCGGEGRMIETFTYYGFYYTPDNKPMGWMGNDVDFSKNDTIWTWDDPESDNVFYNTERIRDNWFYFELIQ